MVDTSTKRRNKLAFNINKYLSEISTRYEENDSNQSLNFLLLGESGSGKTFTAGSTMPRPVFIDSFDRGGAKGLKHWIKKGEVFVDERWEEEDPQKPEVFEKWKKEMESRAREGFFDYLGTYILDSATTWGNAVMNQVLKKAGRAGEAPQWAHDYGPQKMIVGNWVRKLLNMPCNFVLTGHLKADKDEVTNKIQRRFLTTGQLSVTLPLLFDEIYVMDPKSGSKGTTYRILTSSTGTDMARSRLAQAGLLDQYEKPDFLAMMKKCKWEQRKPKPMEEE